jgi:ketosteroid isomerase-like protein
MTKGADVSRESDIRLIMELPCRYSDAANRRDWDDFQSVYAEEARWQVPGVKVDVTGAKNIRDWAEAAFKENAFFLQLIYHQVLVRYEPDVANTYTYFQAFSRRYDGSGFQYIMVYDDEMARNGEKWEFSNRVGHFLYRDNHALQGIHLPIPELTSFK